MRPSTSFALRSGLIAAALALLVCHARAGESAVHFSLTNAGRGPAVNRLEIRGESPFPGQKMAIWGPPSFALNGTIRIWRRAPHRPVWREEAAKDVQTSSAPPWIIFARQFLGSGNPTHRAGPWCAFFASFVLERTGHRPLSSGLASSALSYGPRLSGPSVGALAVLGRASHVGFVEAVQGDRVTILSGNWSRRVSRAVLPRRAFAAFIGV